MHNPGFAIIIWAIDIFSVLALLRLVAMIAIVMRSRARARRMGVGGGRTWRQWWFINRELVVLYIWNVLLTFGGIWLAHFLFGAPRWLRHLWS